MTAPNLTAPLLPAPASTLPFTYPGIPTAAPKPLGIPTTITPKRKANNERTQAKRREGTHLANVANATTGFGPAPQVTLPPPPAPQTAVPFTPATYKPPNRGLEYLAMGVALLFPGAPIAKAAAGLLQGLNQGAQTGYERNEQAAEQKYQTQEQQAEVAHQNAVDAYTYGVQKAQVNAQNLAAVEQQRAQLAAQGINWVTGKPFVYPSLQQVAGRNTSAQGIMGAYTSLIQMASRNGDTTSIAAYTQAAKDYEAQVMQQDKDLQAMQRLYITQQGANNRAEARIGAEEGMLEQREQFDLALRNMPTPMERANLTAEAQRAMSSFVSEYRSYTTPQGLNPALLAQSPQLTKMLGIIQRSQNPQEQADRFASQTQSQPMVNLLNDAGNAFALVRQSRGMPILPLPAMPRMPSREPMPPFTAPAGYTPFVKNGTWWLRGTHGEEQQALSNGQPIRVH